MQVVHFYMFLNLFFFLMIINVIVDIAIIIDEINIDVFTPVFGFSVVFDVCLDDLVKKDNID